MISLPLCAAILVIGALVYQHKHYQFILSSKSLDQQMAENQTLEKLQEEMKETRKKLDVITLKVGLKF
jgi:hypothetical protein